MRNETMTLNMGPQHPSTHGVLRVVLELDGETVLRAKPILGYLHTGMEKQAEYKTYTQSIPQTDRMDYLSQMSNNMALCLAVAKLLGHADGVLPRQATGDDTADAPDRVAWSLADAVPPGTSAAVALLEHVWASPLRDAIRRANGVPLDETWLAAEDLERLAARA